MNIPVPLNYGPGNKHLIKSFLPSRVTKAHMYYLCSHRQDILNLPLALPFITGRVLQGNIHNRVSSINTNFNIFCFILIKWTVEIASKKKSIFPSKTKAPSYEHITSGDHKNFTIWCLRSHRHYLQAGFPRYAPGQGLILNLHTVHTCLPISFLAYSMAYFLINLTGGR